MKVGTEYDVIRAYISNGAGLIVRDGLSVKDLTTYGNGISKVLRNW